MSTPTTIDAVFAKAYEDALKHGSGLYQTRIINQILQAKHVRASDLFRFRFIPGKSHAHSRKIWRERSRRSFTWKTFTIGYDLPEPSAEVTEACQRYSRKMSDWIDRACFGVLEGK